MECCCSPIGMGEGGRIRQTIEKDDHDLEESDLLHSSRVFVHLVNSEEWRELTGRAMPRPPVTAEEYNAAGYPWFEWYGDGDGVPGSKKLSAVKSVGDLDPNLAKKDEKVPDPEHVITLNAKKIADGDW